MRNLKVRYLVVRWKTNKKEERTPYFYWMPKREIADRYSLKTKRLASHVSRQTPYEAVLSIAIREAEEFNAELDRLRAHKVAKDPADVPGTIPNVWKRFKANSLKFKSKSKDTRRFYSTNMKHILKWSELAGHPHVRQITRAACIVFINGLYKEDSVTGELTNERTAYAVYQTLRRLLNFAKDLGHLEHNPAAALGFSAPKSREQIWTDEQVEMVCQKAIEKGRRSLAMGVRMGADLGQRQGDTLPLMGAHYDKEGGIFRIRQSKTEQLVHVPVTRKLKEMLDEVDVGQGEAFIVNESTGKPYVADTFRHDLRETMLELELTDIWYLDLRRTAVVNLARAGCTIPEITAITGHDVDTCAKIIEVYMPRDEVMALNALERLEAYRDRLEEENRNGE